MSIKKPDPYAIDAGGAERTTPAPAPSPAEAAAALPTGSDLFSFVDYEGVKVVEFSRPDVLDASYIERLGDHLKDWINTLERPRIVLDLHNVRHLSSSALGMFIVLKNTVDARGGKICISNVQDEIKQVFKLTKLHKLLKLHDTTRKACATMK